MQGDEAPGGTGVFQSWLVPGPSSTGGLANSETPELLGPRNCGHQDSALLTEPAALTVTTRMKTVNLFILVARLSLGPEDTSMTGLNLQSFTTTFRWRSLSRPPGAACFDTTTGKPFDCVAVNFRTPRGVLPTFQKHSLAVRPSRHCLNCSPVDVSLLIGYG
jgi:hypothetical protein